jgi:hypothetical protein
MPVRLLEYAQTTFQSIVYHKEVDIRHFRKHRRLVTVPKVELAPAAHIFNDKVAAFQMTVLRSSSTTAVAWRRLLPIK